VEAIGKHEEDLCLACVSAKYPTCIDGEEERFRTNLDEHTPATH